MENNQPPDTAVVAMTGTYHIVSLKVKKYGQTIQMWALQIDAEGDTTWYTSVDDMHSLVSADDDQAAFLDQFVKKENNG